MRQWPEPLNDIQSFQLYDVGNRLPRKIWKQLVHGTNAVWKQNCSYYFSRPTSSAATNLTGIEFCFVAATSPACLGSRTAEKCLRIEHASVVKNALCKALVVRAAESVRPSTPGIIARTFCYVFRDGPYDKQRM